MIAVILVLFSVAFAGVAAALVVAVRRTRETRRAGEAANRGALLHASPVRLSVEGISDTPNMYAVQVYERQVAVIVDDPAAKQWKPEWYVEPKDIIEVGLDTPSRFLWSLSVREGVRLRFRSGGATTTVVAAPRDEPAEVLCEAIRSVVSTDSA
jgi:hypothetical protein